VCKNDSPLLSLLQYFTEYSNESNLDITDIRRYLLRILLPGLFLRHSYLNSKSGNLDGI